MNTVRPTSMMDLLRKQAAARKTIDYEAARRAQLQAESPNWQPLTLLNGWQAVNFFGTGFVPPAWWRDRWGFIHVRGHVGHAVLDANPIVQLPTQSLPGQEYRFSAIMYVYWSTYQTQTAWHALLRCLKDGTISRHPSGTSTAYASSNGPLGFLSLDRVYFPAANQGAR